MIDSKDVVTAEEWKKIIEKMSNLLPDSPEEPWQYIYIMRKVPKHIVDEIEKERNKELAESKFKDALELLKEINNLGYRVGVTTYDSGNDDPHFRVIPYWELNIE